MIEPTTDELVEARQLCLPFLGNVTALLTFTAGYMTGQFLRLAEVVEAIIEKGTAPPPAQIIREGRAMIQAVEEQRRMAGGVE